MARICLTAGPALADLLWSVNVLPVLRRALPGAHLAWECPAPDAGEWLRYYPELDEVVGDVEEMQIAPDVYLILHPWWHDKDLPIAGLFDSIGAWCPLPNSLPNLAYCPPMALDLPPLPDLPGTYLCFDPNLKPGETSTEGTRHDLAAVLAVLPLPAVQIGAKAAPLLPFVIDARGCSASAMAHLINHAKLFIGGDGDGSVMAGALRRKQIWIEIAGSNWWWPRGTPPDCLPYRVETKDYLDTPALSALAQNMLGDLEVRP